MSQFALDCVAVYDQVVQVLGGKGLSDPQKAAIKNEIQTALADILHAYPWSWRRKEMTVSITAGTAGYTLPEDFDGMVVAEMHEDTSHGLVARITDRQFMESIASDETGEPNHYRITWKTTASTGQYIMQFAPEPDGSYTYSGVEYWRSCPKLTFNASTGTTPLMPTEFYSLWAGRAKAKAAHVVGEHVLAERFEAEAERLLNDARRRWDSDAPSGPPGGLESAYGDGAWIGF